MQRIITNPSYLGRRPASFRLRLLLGRSSAFMSSPPAHGSESESGQESEDGQESVEWLQMAHGSGSEGEQGEDQDDDY
jgi:hypothetical protein